MVVILCASEVEFPLLKRTPPLTTAQGSLSSRCLTLVWPARCSWRATPTWPRVLVCVLSSETLAFLCMSVSSEPENPGTEGGALQLGQQGTFLGSWAYYHFPPQTGCRGGGWRRSRCRSTHSRSRQTCGATASRCGRSLAMARSLTKGSTYVQELIAPARVDSLDSSGFSLDDFPKIHPVRTRDCVR